jgi:PAS domain S-box-containing protein
MRLSIRYKLLLGFALLLSLSSLIYTLAFKITKDYVYYQIGIVQTEKAQSAAQKVQDFVADVERDHLSLTKQYLELYETSPDQFINILSYITKTDRYFKKTAILNTAGRKIVEVDSNGGINEDGFSFEIPTDPFVLAVKGQTAFSKVYFTPSDLGPQLDIFSPILSPEKNTIGIIRSQLDITQIWDIISQIKLGDTGFAYIVDDSGRIIAHPNQSLVLNGTNVKDREVVADLITKNNYLPTPADEDHIYTNEHNVDVIAKGLKIPQVNWSVIVEEPVSEASSFLEFNRNLFYLTLTGSILLLIIISLFLSENLTGPMRKLQGVTNLLKQGNFKTRANITSGDEIEDLANSFNLMAGQLQQREKSIQAEKYQMEVLLQSLNDGVIAADQNNRIILFNRAAEKITELSSEEAMNRDIDGVLKFYRDEEIVPFARYQIQAEKIIDNLKLSGLSFVTKFGKKKIVAIHVAPIDFDTSEEKGWLITIHDITEEQELEEMKLDFVAMAAHELRTPLTAIRGYLDILTEEASEKLTDEHRTFLQRIVIGTKQLSTLVENLLNVSRIEQGNLKLELHPIRMEDVIDSNMSNLTELAIQRGVQLSFIRPEKTTSNIMVDKFRIGEVITNLISNGISYTQMGGWVKIILEETETDIVLRVSDNGQGIPAEALPHLFTKFYRVSGKLEQGSKGTGLGLFISKAIVDAHRGKIAVQSILGQGTTFTLTLPKIGPDGENHPIK